MRRALGAITDWETFKNATESEYELPDNAMLRPSKPQKRRSSVAEATANAKISAQKQVATVEKHAEQHLPETHPTVSSQAHA